MTFIIYDWSILRTHVLFILLFVEFLTLALHVIKTFIEISIIVLGAIDFIEAISSLHEILKIRICITMVRKTTLRSKIIVGYFIILIVIRITSSSITSTIWVFIINIFIQTAQIIVVFIGHAAIVIVVSEIT